MSHYTFTLSQTVCVNRFLLNARLSVAIILFMSSDSNCEIFNDKNAGADQIISKEAGQNRQVSNQSNLTVVWWSFSTSHKCETSVYE